MSLQRSSCSFRRQGSSGRVWGDVNRISDVKPSNKSRDFRYHPIPTSNVPQPDSIALDHPPRRSTSESKIKRCGFVSVFLCCIRSSSS
ncbi:hypothetical protein CASFOL_033004 [Castilleja foliolosa]|uniref:Uncharacterized protein n=1 Tax=Castilleja foliolosa TaxID=1961234 RepID=A0ABD3C332_9LAMI